MARLTACFGTSHSTMLVSSRENWLRLFDHVDRHIPVLDFDGIERPFDELVKNRPPEAAALLAPGSVAARHEATMAALDRLEGTLAAAALDALIIVGDDQREVFRDDLRPAIAIYCGETIRNAAAPAEPPEDWYLRDQNLRLEDGRDAFYPVRADLAEHLIGGLSRGGFDITAVRALPADKYEGHAFSFIHRRFLARAPVPIVPVFLNTYYPPNQPSPRRCRELGEGLRALIASFPQDIKVGVLASGGLSHFLVNEALDASVIEAMRDGDLEALAALPPGRLESGSSEIRNWICTAAAARDLKLDWIEYVPGYRSQALTGVGLCFASWKPPTG